MTAALAGIPLAGTRVVVALAALAALGAIVAVGARHSAVRRRVGVAVTVVGVVAAGAAVVNTTLDA